MHYYLLDKWHKSFILPEGCQAVALNENTIYQLEKCNIPYVVLEDYYKSFEIRGDIDAFTLHQLEWFGEFDSYLKEVFKEAKELDVNLANIYYYGLKYLVDNVILVSLALRQFMEKGKPTKVSFVGMPYTEERFDHLIGVEPPVTTHAFEGLLDKDFTKEEGLYSFLIDLICQDYGVEFERLFFEETEDDSGSFESVHKSSVGTIQKKSKEFVKKIFPAKGISSLKEFFFLKHLIKICSRSHAQKEKKGRVLVLHSLKSTEDFVINLRNHGFHLFFKQPQAVRDIAWTRILNHQRIPHVKSIVQTPNDFDMNDFLKSRIMKWINTECGGIDVSGILSSRLRYFICKICPELLTKIQDYKDYYIKNDIDFVLAPNVWSVDESAAMAAARLSPSTKTIGMGHGADGYETKSRYFYLYRYCDFYISATKGETENEQFLTKYYNQEYPKSYTHDYLFRDLMNTYTKDRIVKPLKQAKGRKVVLFVPVVYPSPAARSFQLNQPFPMEFIPWHRALAEYFSKQKDTFFIWKALIQPIGDQTYDPITQLIGSDKYENVSFEFNKITYWFPYVDRILCDFPSTAFFESMYSSIPAMALYQPKHQILRFNAKDCFGKSIQPYTEIDEGLKVVDNFLNAPKEDYIVPLCEVNEDIPTILENHLKKFKVQKEKQQNNRR